jgi:prepilin-type N-terminal cleavage/methylation domain-containing protein
MPAPVIQTGPRPRRAFTLLELTITIVILGIVAAIAVPRLGGAADNARTAVLRGSLDQLQRAVEFYTAEHAGVPPASDPGGTPPTGKSIISRLMARTDDTGAFAIGGRFGPYLRSWPANPVNGKLGLRVDGASAGAGTHGWRYNSATDAIEPDHAPGQITSAPTRPARTAEEVPD